MTFEVKYFLLVIFVIGCSIRSIECAGEDAILELLEEIRNRMCHPIPKFGLPALDPLQIRHVEFQMDNKYLIDFTGSLTNFRLTGLSDFIVNDLKISMNPFRRSNIDVSLPFTAFKSLYTAKGSLAYILNLSGDGNAAAHVDYVRVSLSWLFKADLYLGIRGLQIKITINEIEIDFEHLIEEDRVNEFFHALVNEMGVELLNDIWQTENSFIEALVEKKINGIIGKYTLGDILKLIGGGSGGGDEPIFGPEDPPGDCKDDVAAV